MSASPHNDSLWRITRGSIIGGARDAAPGKERDIAWQRLVEYYRRPITVCLQRRVRRHPDGEAIVLEFFSYLFTNDVVASWDRAQGRFRAFLQGVMRNYVLSKIREYEMKGDESELHQLLEVDPPPGTEVEEERTWARSLLDRAVEQLLETKPRDGKILLQVYGIPPYPVVDTASIAATHGLSTEAVHKAVSRARQELHRLLEAQLNDLVDGDEDYASEKKALIGRLIEAQQDLLG